MNDELTNVSSEEMSEVDTDYVAAIKELQNNTVSKDQYNKLRSENKKLLDALVRGETIEAQNVKPKADINTLRKDLFGDPDESHDACEFFEKALLLRETLLENGEPDCFLPISSRMAPTDEEIAQAENTAQVYRECLDYAQGDSEVFTNELMRRTIDTGVSKVNRRR